MGGQCASCVEDQVGIQLCFKCIAMWEEKFKRGETMKAYYFGAMNEGKTVLRPEEYRKMNEESKKTFK